MPCGLNQGVALTIWPLPSDYSNHIFKHQILINSPSADNRSDDGVCSINGQILNLPLNTQLRQALIVLLLPETELS